MLFATGARFAEISSARARRAVPPRPWLAGGGRRCVLQLQRRGTCFYRSRRFIDLAPPTRASREAGHRRVGQAGYSPWPEAARSTGSYREMHYLPDVKGEMFPNLQHTGIRGAGASDRPCCSRRPEVDESDFTSGISLCPSIC